jgi:hypothetical protein
MESKTSFFSAYEPLLKISWILKDPVSFSHTSTIACLTLRQSKTSVFDLTASRYFKRFSQFWVGFGMFDSFFYLFTVGLIPVNSMFLLGKYFSKFFSFIYIDSSCNGFTLLFWVGCESNCSMNFLASWKL